jgi:hypothetical protein
MERVRGIEPLSIPWEGIILPMYYTREQDNLLLYTGYARYEANKNCRNHWSRI